jgi:hypothetical protein
VGLKMADAFTNHPSPGCRFETVHTRIGNL